MSCHVSYPLIGAREATLLPIAESLRPRRAMAARSCDSSLRNQWAAKGIALRGRTIVA